MFFLLQNVVDNIFQLHGDIHVINHHMFWSAQGHGHQIEDAFDAGQNHLVKDLLRDSVRYGDDAYFYALLLHKIDHPAHGQYRYGSVGFHFGYIDVKSRCNADTDATKAFVLDNGCPNIAGPDNDNLLCFFLAQYALELFQQAVYLVSGFFVPFYAEDGKILAYLFRCGPCLFGDIG